MQGKTKMDPYAIAIQDEVLAASRQAANDGELNRLLFDDNNDDWPGRSSYIILELQMMFNIINKNIMTRRFINTSYHVTRVIYLNIFHYSVWSTQYLLYCVCIINYHIVITYHIM